MEHLVWWCEFLPLSELNTLIIKVPAPMQTSWISSVVVVKQSCLFIQRQNVLHFNNRFHCLQQYYLTETINLIENLRVIEYFKHIFLQDKPNINFLKNPKCSLTPTCQSASTPSYCIWHGSLSQYKQCSNISKFHISLSSHTIYDNKAINHFSN